MEEEINSNYKNAEENIITNENNKKENKNNEEKKIAVKSKFSVFTIIALICICIYAIAIAPKTLQNDTFYTVTIGDYIYHNGISDLTTDLYSWHELPYTYPHWLYDLGMYIVYNNFGQEGIYASTMILSCILGISVYMLSYKKSKNRVFSLIATIISIVLIKSFVAARAQLITFILFTWTVFFIEKFLETKKFRYAIALWIIPLLITNLHCAVFPFYFVLYLPYIAEYLVVSILDLNLDLKFFKLLNSFKKICARKEEDKNKCTEKIEKLDNEIVKQTERRKELRAKPYKVVVEKNHRIILLIAIMLIAILTGFCNPAGNGAFTYIVKTMQGNTMDSINEHLPLTFVENTSFALCVLVFLAVLIFTDTKIKLSDLFMLIGITYLAFKSRRQVSMFALFCMPILASLMANFFNKYDKDTIKKVEKFFSEWFGAIVIVCLFVIYSSNIIKPTLNSDYIDAGSYPVEAATWILNNLNVKEIKLYNEYNYGSYLLYRGIPVFIDSRCDLYSPEFNGTYNFKTGKYENGRDIFSDALNIAGLGVNYADKLTEYGVTHLILFSNNKLAMILLNDSNYKLLYDDETFRIYEKLDANQTAESANENVQETVNQIEAE